MIHRLRRFHGYNALRYVYKMGKTVRTPMCTLRYSVNPKRSTYRLAVVVSKKQSKSAVVRNRIRRRLYEAGRECIPASSNHDLVITVLNADMATMPTKDLYKIFNDILQMSGIGKR